jgi:hypothetical protein
MTGNGEVRKENCSFLKKRTKKLLHIASGVSFTAAPRVLPLKSKSFLVLFFKEEHFLSFPCLHPIALPTRLAVLTPRLLRAPEITPS